MSDIALGIQVVRVTQTGDEIHGQPITQLWLAAVQRDQAVDAVQRELPAGWHAELTNERLSQEEVRRLGMRAGEVRERTS